MDKIDKLLKYVQKTNPEMTRDLLIKELSKCRYSTAGLIIVFENHQAEKNFLKKFNPPGVCI